MSLLGTGEKTEELLVWISLSMFNKISINDKNEFKIKLFKEEKQRRNIYSRASMS